MSNVVGKGWGFPPKPGSREKMDLVDGDTDIRQAILIILGTALGERVMRPDFGCRIHELIFAPANDQTAALAERYAKEALTRWEPRIEIKEVKAYPSNNVYGELIIDISYEIKDHNDRRNLVYPFYLSPGEDSSGGSS
jgi:uncharacterized protein